jgi:hypothetical protein
MTFSLSSSKVALIRETQEKQNKNKQTAESTEPTQFLQEMGLKPNTINLAQKPNVMMVLTM